MGCTNCGGGNGFIEMEHLGAHKAKDYLKGKQKSHIQKLNQIIQNISRGGIEQVNKKKMKNKKNKAWCNFSCLAPRNL